MKLTPPTSVAAVAGAAMLAGSASAAVVLDEHFDYAPGALNVANSDWSAGFNVTTPGLTHANLDGEAGNAATGSAARSTIVLGDTFGDADETVYLSFLMQTDTNINNGSDPGGSFETIELYNGGTRVYSIGLLRSDGDTASAQFEHRAYAAGQTGATTPALGAFNDDTNLFVTRFTYTAAGDTLTIDGWLNPDDTTDLDAASNRITLASGAFDFNALALAGFAQGSPADGVTFDEVRVADTAPTLIPEPGSLALLALGGLMVARRRRG